MTRNPRGVVETFQIDTYARLGVENGQRDGRALAVCNREGRQQPLLYAGGLD